MENIPNKEIKCIPNRVMKNIPDKENHKCRGCMYNFVITKKNKYMRKTGLCGKCIWSKNIDFYDWIE
jgi:hypothetical protein